MSQKAKGFVKKAFAQLNKALKQYGTYTFDDKGPHEVMDVEPLKEELKVMPSEDALAALRLMVARKDGRGHVLAETIIGELRGEGVEWLGEALLIVEPDDDVDAKPIATVGGRQREGDVARHIWQTKMTRMDNTFTDAQEMRRLHPHTFEAPTAEEVSVLTVPANVKVCVGNERFWVKVASIDKSNDDPFRWTFKALVRSHLILTDEHGVKFEDEVEFEGRHIYSI